ncbi:MAG: hypothetical protein R3F56_11865 [Planctomycetota bacterium]
MTIDRRHAVPPPCPRAGLFSTRGFVRGAALSATLAGLVVIGGCSATSSNEDRVHDLLVSGDLTRAYWELEQAVQANPDDAELRRRLGELRIAYHLREGQQKVFEDDDWGAVEEFERVLLAEPDNPVAQHWKDKALVKLADRAVAAGDDARARGKLEDALKHYHEAETYLPGHPEAARGTRLVGEVFSARRDKGQANYVKGMRAQAGGRFDETHYHMDIALDNDPSLSAAEERRRVARRQLAEERRREAQEAEERGLFATALREYKAVAVSFPDLAEELAPKIAATEREVAAAEKLNEGTLLAQRGEFAKARALLEQAYEASAVQRGEISAQLVALREADLEKRYTAALDLELDYHYDDALRAYREIDASWPGQLDVRTRIQNLETALELAREAQTKGEEAEANHDVDAAISAYREALTYVPKFGDLVERVERLRAAKAKDAGGVPTPSNDSGSAKPVPSTPDPDAPGK